MDSYDKVSLNLSKGPLIKIRIFDQVLGTSKKLFLLYFKVTESADSISLSTLSDFLQKVSIRRFNRILSQETFWIKLDIYLLSTNLRYSVTLPNKYGLRVGSAQAPFGKKPFVSVRSLLSWS